MHTFYRLYIQFWNFFYFIVFFFTPLILSSHLLCFVDPIVAPRVLVDARNRARVAAALQELVKVWEKFVQTNA